MACNPVSAIAAKYSIAPTKMQGVFLGNSFDCEGWTTWDTEVPTLVVGHQGFLLLINKEIIKIGPIKFGAKMLVDLAVISLWGGLVALDTTAAFQVLISHPLVSGAVIGLLLGNFPMGFAIGVILELIWLSEFPVGAAPFSEGNIGAAVAAAVGIISAGRTGRPEISLSLALLVGVLISMIGGHLVVLLRKINGRLYENILDNKKLTINMVERYHFSGIALAFLSGMLLTAVSVAFFGFLLLPAIIAYLPKSIDKFLAPVSAAFLGIGCGVLFYLFLSRKNWWLIIVGAASGTVLYFS